jgi:methylenetetrahydrofolate reductase (NADPH)
MCAATIPDKMREAFETVAPVDVDKLSHDLCVKQCEDLLKNGIESLHFYTLNKPNLTLSICKTLGVTPLF